MLKEIEHWIWLIIYLFLISWGILLNLLYRSFGPPIESILYNSSTAFSTLDSTRLPSCKPSTDELQKPVQGPVIILCVVSTFCVVTDLVQMRLVIFMLYQFSINQYSTNYVVCQIERKPWPTDCLRHYNNMPLFDNVHLGDIPLMLWIFPVTVAPTL